MGDTRNRLEKYREQYEKCAAREENLKQKIKTEERKRRNHLLIQLGVVIESMIGRSLEEEDIERLKKFLQKQEDNGKFFTKAMNPKMESANVFEHKEGVIL